MNLWTELTGAALIGTGRRESTDLALNGKDNDPLAGLVANLQESLAPEDALLAAAGAAVLHQQIGWLPEQTASDQPQPAPGDERPPRAHAATY
jgi:hypothetical protein